MMARFPNAFDFDDAYEGAKYPTTLVLHVGDVQRATIEWIRAFVC